MVLFYLGAAVLAVITAALLARPLLGGRNSGAGRAAREAELYRAQLAELEREIEAGVVGGAEAEAARAEIGRRLLRAVERARAEEDAGRTVRAPEGATRLVAAAAAIAVPLASAGLYLVFGAPDLPSRPLAERTAADAYGLAGTPALPRLSQAEAERAFGEPAPAEVPAELERYAELIAHLEQIVAKRPEDARGLALLAEGYMRLGRHRDAVPVLRRLIEVKEARGEGAEADDFANLAEAMILAAGGYVSAEARAALAEAVNHDPSLPQARYYAALSLAQDGRVDEAVSLLGRLHAEAPPDAPWRPMVSRMLAQLSGASVGPAPAAPAPDGGGGDAPGPSAADVAAAQQMSPAERQAMIEGMVARLESRLTTEGGSPEEWVRLMNAYVQLGRREDAERVARLALDAFAGRDEAGFIRERALVMGLGVE